MFSVVKVRDGLARNDYKDPGWFKHPPGTVAREWTGTAPAAASAAPAATGPRDQVVQARKPGGHGRH
jgi:hypothetical protein